MAIPKAKAQISYRKINAEAASLNPSALITMIEIDISEIETGENIVLSDEEKVFRFHSSVKATTNDIFWRGLRYFALPIQTDGFEFNSRGTIPTPRLSLSVRDEDSYVLSLFRAKLNEIGDLVGAKVTRIRTFSRYLDANNYPDGLPSGFEPDPFAEFPRDIFYIDRKVIENKNQLSFDLASKLDIENIKLPNRKIYANRCPFSYRGEGCLYEYSNRKVDSVHGPYASLPAAAPPVANDKDELLTDVLDVSSFNDRGEWDSLQLYSLGDSVYIVKNNVKYYFVCKTTNTGVPPPSISFWVTESCSKLVSGCRLRWANKGNGTLPFGGFIGVNKVQ